LLKSVVIGRASQYKYVAVSNFPLIFTIESFESDSCAIRRKTCTGIPRNSVQPRVSVALTQKKRAGEHRPKRIHLKGMFAVNPECNRPNEVATIRRQTESRFCLLFFFHDYVIFRKNDFWGLGASNTQFRLGARGSVSGTSGCLSDANPPYASFVSDSAKLSRQFCRCGQRI